jgi:electron transfer flavoprotein alpha/beta subunit
MHPIRRRNAREVVQTSNEASTNVKTAAVAADELSRSIVEIAHRLNQTNDVVRVAVGEVQATNQDIAALAQGAQKIGDVTKLIQISRANKSARPERHDRGGAPAKRAAALRWSLPR